MLKELIISIIIVISIFMGDFFTQNYTNKIVKEMSDNLFSLREEIIKDNVNSDVAKKSIESINESWGKKYKNLAYYIEHDELEKVKTELTALNAHVDVEEYSEAVADLDKGVYILEHIKDKTSLNLKNIF